MAAITAIMVSSMGQKLPLTFQGGGLCFGLYAAKNEDFLPLAAPNDIPETAYKTRRNHRAL